MAHVLGLITLASYVPILWFGGRYFWRTATRPWSWQQPVRVAKLPREDHHYHSGADYVGGWI